LLARLKKKHGVHGVAKMLAQVDARPAGRPPNLFKAYEDMALAETIDNRAAEYLKQGNRKPLEMAILDAYEFEYSSGRKRPSVDSYRRKVKKWRKRARGFDSYLRQLKSRGDIK